MKRIRIGLGAAFLGLVICLGSVAAGRALADTFYGTAPTGLLELQEYKYPVFLYVPQNYKPDRSYALMVQIPQLGEAPEKSIEYWTGVGKRRSMLVLCATSRWPQDVPYNYDEWLLGIKKDVMKRYKVDPDRVFLSGERSAAHYAAYLGTNYPNEFSAAVLLAGSWTGDFEKLLHLQSRPVKQIPFLVVAPTNEPVLIADIEASAVSFEKKGYSISLMKVKDKELFDLLKFKKKILEWLTENSETWKSVSGESRKSKKEKFTNWVEDFFRV